MGDAKESVLQCKVVLIGASGTGKTSIIYRLIHNAFESQLRTTLGAGLSTYHTRFETHQVKLNIWDTAGQENYRGLARIYFRDAQCVLIVYDIADHATFDDVNYWLEELEQLTPDSHFRVLVASKCDLRGTRAVSEDDGRELARKINASLYEVSALSGEGVVALFDSVAERFVRFSAGKKIGDRSGPEERGERGQCCKG
jgi:small GTP-binding protein